MAYEKNRYHKPLVTIGAIGDSNQGKTMLAAAILKTQSQQWIPMAEALSYADIAQGGEFIDDEQIVTITSTQVEYESPMRYYTHIDCPGRAEYSENAAASMAQMQGAILVVSAMDGVTPQTREHVRLAREAGICAIVVYMNKCERYADREMMRLCEWETRELLNEYGFDGENVPIIHGSALFVARGWSERHTDIDSLLEALDRHIPQPNS